MLRFGTINVITAILLVILWACNTFFYPLAWGSYLIMMGLWLLLTTIGSFHIRWNYHIDSLNVQKNDPRNCVALTFDDGPHPEITPKVLSLLKRYNAKATFFCIGQNAEAHSPLIENLISEGHTIGNHTYSHSNGFGFFSTQKVVAELHRTNKTIKNITGKEMNLYRPAFGVTNPSIKKALKATGLQSIGWSIRSLDTTDRSKDQILHRITHDIGQGDVVLLHDTSEKSVAVLEQLLLFLQERNLRSVTIDQLFNLKAYD